MPKAPPKKMKAYNFVKVACRDDWRVLSPEEKMLRATLIIQAIVNGIHYNVISRSVNITTDIIGLLSQLNGTARKGPYKGCIPARIPNPLITDIDAIPSPQVTLKWNEEQNSSIADRTIIEEEVTEGNIPEDDDVIAGDDTIQYGTYEDTDIETVDESHSFKDTFRADEAPAECYEPTFQEKLDYAFGGVTSVIDDLGFNVHEIDVLTKEGHVFRFGGNSQTSR